MKFSNPIARFSVLLVCMAAIACAFASCAKDGAGTYITPAEPDVTFGNAPDVVEIAVDTDIKNLTCSVTTGEEWCFAEYRRGKLTVSVAGNLNLTSRFGMVLLNGDGVTATVNIRQGARGLETNGVGNDIRIAVARASSSTPTEDDEAIELSYDGDPDTFYLSQYCTSLDPPITIKYEFGDVPSLDYMIYHPVIFSGSKGQINEVDVYVTTRENPNRVKVGRYDFGGRKFPSSVIFSPAVKNPVSVELEVQSSVNSYVSCAEIEFYRYNPAAFNYLDVFADKACTKLKTGITEGQIDAIGNEFFRNIARDIFNGVYDDEFRVQEYRAWQHPDVMAASNKTRYYGLRDNPTGIYATKGEDIIFFAGDLHGSRVSLLISDPDGRLTGESYAVNEGMNKIRAGLSGLIYVMYYTATGSEPAVTIHFATGSVNGYFDSRKHEREDWTKLLQKASFRHFNVLGNYTSLTFETQAFRAYTPDGLDLVEAYDDMVRMQQEFMGLVKYDREYANRLYFLVLTDSYMHASDYYTGYNTGTQSEILDVAKFKTSAVWGPAHEVGHIHQTRPGLRWRGMTEVTNNIHSLLVQTAWGNKSRLLDVVDGKTVYQRAKADIIDAAIAHNACRDVFCQLVPFWQLKLYMHDVLGKNDFYKDVYEEVRKRSDPNTDGLCQLNFVEIVCDVAKLDMTDFFESWGFFRPIYMQITDYTTDYFRVSESMIEQTRANIAAKKYAKPKHNDIHLLTDENVGEYKKSL
ncbi:M60 family metallopeptidase [Alistipes sp. OttesenSCG-928-B03]|nr:M60 family metallopeptidase [Alistipes sp. OttesenSCG-928-B03]